jgi:hypothetical protein
LVAKKQYAKRKAMYLNRCFQTGEQPIPGPLIGGNHMKTLFLQFTSKIQLILFIFSKRVMVTKTTDKTNKTRGRLVEHPIIHPQKHNLPQIKMTHPQTDHQVVAPKSHKKRIGVLHTMKNNRHQNLVS